MVYPYADSVAVGGSYLPAFTIDHVAYFVHNGSFYAYDYISHTFGTPIGSGITDTQFTVDSAGRIFGACPSSGSDDAITEYTLSPFTKVRHGNLWSWSGYNAKVIRIAALSTNEILVWGSVAWDYQPGMYRVSTSTWTGAKVAVMGSTNVASLTMADDGYAYAVDLFSTCYRFDPATNAVESIGAPGGGWSAGGSIVHNGTLWQSYYGGNSAPWRGWWSIDLNSSAIGYDASLPMTDYSAIQHANPTLNAFLVNLGNSVGTIYMDAPFFHGFTRMDFGVAPEWGYEPTISPSLTWIETASGLWRCRDDGAAFDAFDAEITVLLPSSKLSMWESWISSNRGAEVTYYAPSGVRPFGPHIDCTAGVQVVVGDAWKEQGRVGIKADCWTLHIPMRYVGGYTPASASTPSWMGRKFPTASWRYPTTVHRTEAGTAIAAPRAEETQTAQIVVDNLDQETAAAAVNWALWLRGASFTYSPAAGAYPFGPSAGDGPFSCRLIGWTCQKPRPNRWDMTLNLSRET